MRKAEQERLWTPTYLYLLIIIAVTNISSNLIMTAFARYAVECGISLGFAGVLTGMFSLVALVGRPVAGALADRFSQCGLMMISVGGIVLSALLYPFCRTPATLFAVRLLHGLFFSLNGTVSMAFASSFVPASRTGEGMGYFGLCAIVGQAVAPALGFALADRYGYNVCFFSVCLLNAIALFMMFFLQKGKEKPRSHGKKLVWRDLFLPELLPYSLFTAAFSMVNGICSSFLALMGEAAGIGNVSIFFTVSAVVLFFVRPLAGKLNDQKGLGAVTYPGYVFSLISLVLLALMRSPLLLIGAAVCKALGQGMAQPAFQAECIRRAGPECRGVAVSMYYLGADIGNGIAPVVGGYVADAWGYPALNLGGAAVMGICILCFFLFQRREKAVGQERQAPAEG